ncbi:PP2C family serine/threonine-protein phosphatase [Alloscardovia omnicolens]|uniref:PP2C family protein-serine/threonine phosphatase n=1 Tax=Alloscardovia omnicolens TaxID=419015 RepID=UPI003A724CA6
MALSMISTTVSDIGLVRKDNQDSTFAGARLVAVCDGMGGHAGGDTASTIAVRSLAHIENIPLVANKAQSVEDVAGMLTTSIIAAHDAIVGKARREKALAGMGTTVTAVAMVGGYWVLAHIGDSRAYLLRDGEIIRVTKDHSYVQHLIDTGRISEDEAKSHPQRNVVMRVLGDFDIDPRPDVSIRKAQPGDRWLLCSDGLSGVISDDSLRDILITHPHAQECAQTLVGLAEKSGSTDNISVVIADSYEENDPQIPTALTNSSDEMCLIAGAVSTKPQPIADTLNMLVAIAPQFIPDHISNSPALRAAQLTAQAREKDSSSPETFGAQNVGIQKVGTHNAAAQKVDVQNGTADNALSQNGAEQNVTADNAAAQNASAAVSTLNAIAHKSESTDNINGAENEASAETSDAAETSSAAGNTVAAETSENLENTDNISRADQHTRTTSLFGVASLIESSVHDADSDEEDFDARYEIQRIVRPSHVVDDVHDTAGLVEATGEIPVILKRDGSIIDDPHDPEVIDALKVKRITDAQKHRRFTLRRRILWAIPTLLLIIAGAVGSIMTYNWSQSRYFIKDHDGQVAIYQGVNTNIFGYSLNHVLEDTTVTMKELPQGWQERIRKGIETQDYRDARNTVSSIEKQARSTNEK